MLVRIFHTWAVLAIIPPITARTWQCL